jgi:hypothetical protein
MTASATVTAVTAVAADGDKSASKTTRRRPTIMTT